MAAEKNFNDQLKPIKNQVSQLTNMTWLVIIVLFIGFAAAFIAVGGLIVNYEADQQAGTKQLDTDIQSLSNKIDTLTKK